LQGTKNFDLNQKFLLSRSNNSIACGSAANRNAQLREAVLHTKDEVHVRKMAAELQGIYQREPRLKVSSSKLNHWTI
jgi:hypothetical protein